MCVCVCNWLAQLVKISDYQPGGPAFSPMPGQELNFGQLSFATLSVVGMFSY